MFALPGICALILFMLARPQEYFEVLQRLPLLYLFCGAAIGGFAIDLRLRRLQPIAAPTLPWVIAFLLWMVICDAKAETNLVQHLIEVGIIFTLYGTIAHGVQGFRAFHVVAGAVLATCLALSFVCFHQGFQDRSCVAVDPEHPGEGTPDDRPCVLHSDCNGPGAEPGQEYKCEKVGLFGSFSVEDRVRYRGELHDPNELSMTVSVGGFAFLLAFALIKRNVRWTILALIGTVLVFGTVVMSQSRGGQAVFLLIIGVFFVKRFGVAGLLVGMVLALPVLLLGGRSGAAADESTALRYDAWLAGLQMLKSSPIFGVGHRLFTQHHFMTAHNSYVLTLAELGIVGCSLFVTLLWLSVKTLWTGVRELEHVPGAEVARIWGLTLLASFIGLIFQINTLSFAYHTVLWIFFGLAGAYASAVRRHKPDFEVRMTARDLLLVGTIVIAYAFVVLPIFLRWKGAS